MSIKRIINEDKNKKKISSICRFDFIDNVKAKNIAQKVIGNNKAFELEPMSPAERRVVHASLTNNTKVTTISKGNGFDRHVVIKPV